MSPNLIISLLQWIRGTSRLCSFIWKLLLTPTLNLKVFDRISKPYQKFLESLTATYSQPGFNEAAIRNGFKLFTEARGAPENVGEDLTAVHPVIRTNPVTG